ncbi:tRNA pseudouridine synthase-like 1 [Spodoptera litura]|uniref:tRNA pseudouridine synthase n=1 Tax=Spodoptera litura TaxID=69820 RepID=A0A9J7IMG4_SPOLT|nr:tRNA pseudouridine synthase-like 1 [Spodoptera litura]
MKARYLTFFSYIGTPFRSSEKIWLREGRNHPDPESVQGLMELALLKLRSLNYPSLVLSSRTDGGVHALNTSAHFDLERFGSKIYEPEGITYTLNKFFYNHNNSIFVKKVIRVPDNFNARHKAIGRSYLYRLAVKRDGIVLPENVTIASYIPIEEWKRCHFVRLPGFDIEKFKEATKYFIGIHDFTTFKKFDKLKQHKHNRREVQSIVVRPGKPLITSYPREDGIFDYWDIEIRGRGFVHNQIRRMVGTLNAVAIGKLPAEEIKVMLQVPSKHSWHNFIQSGPPDGLYLCDVHYKPEDLIYNPESNQEKEECLSDSECD